MALSQAERSAAYRGRKRERESQRLDPVAGARSAIDAGVGVLWSMHQRGDPVVEVDADDPESFRLRVAERLACGGGATKLRAWLGVAQVSTDDAAELDAIGRAMGVLEAVHLAHALA